MSLAAITMRGLGEAWDMQIAAARLILQTQARAFSIFGWQDSSALYRVGDGRARRAFSDMTEQMLQVAQQTQDALSEVQREFGRLLEYSTVNFAEAWQQGLDAFSHQAGESLQQIRSATRHQADEVMRATDALADVAREAVREGGEQFRENVRGAASQGREAMEEVEGTARAAEEEERGGGRGTRAA